ncbi:MAG: MoxR family ATPase, partial [Clostridia bacterium]|nr:MoxR family ATPase [Clostridia bacterium]
LDRFLVRLSLGYPDRASQVALMRDRHIGNPLENCRPVTDAKSLEKMSSEAMSVHVADSIYDYVSELAEASRKDPYVLLGISPRGALAVCRAAKANAYLDGRDYVIPADVAAIFSDVAAHRMVLSNKAKLHEHTAASIADGILRNVKRPDVREFSSK